MILMAVGSSRRLFKLIALVMANHRSRVIIVSVKTDKWLAKFVRKPAALQPAPYCQSKAKLKYSPIECKSMQANRRRYNPMHMSASAKLHIRNLKTVNSLLKV